MKYKIILASKSPRRHQMLTELGIPFSVKSLDVDENYPATMHPHAVARFLAEQKAKAYASFLQENELLITADTTVVVNGQILEKPVNAHEARGMLAQLSGKMHEVITGVCVYTRQSQKSFEDITRVWFRKLEKEEIEQYIQTCHPFDKAGSYAIQEWIGMIGIEKIQGSYFNVVGLPTEKLYSTLKSMHAL